MLSVFLFVDVACWVCFCLWMVHAECVFVCGCCMLGVFLFVGGAVWVCFC